MSSVQIDKLCLDWLRQNYGEEIAAKYRFYSLLTPIWNPPDLNEALKTLRQALCIAFGPDQSFGTTDYHEARKRLQLREERAQIPEVFLRAFAGQGAVQA